MLERKHVCNHAKHMHIHDVYWIDENMVKKWQGPLNLEYTALQSTPHLTQHLCVVDI